MAVVFISENVLLATMRHKMAMEMDVNCNITQGLMGVKLFSFSIMNTELFAFGSFTRSRPHVETN